MIECIGVTMVNQKGKEKRFHRQGWSNSMLKVFYRSMVLKWGLVSLRQRNKSQKIKAKLWSLACDLISIFE